MSELVCRLLLVSSSPSAKRRRFKTRADLNQQLLGAHQRSAAVAAAQIAHHGLAIVARTARVTPSTRAI
jgi:hypothetical protein